MRRRAFLLTAGAFALAGLRARAAVTGSFTIPMEVHNSRPIVQLTFHGRNGAAHDVTAWIDTGAEDMVLTHQLAHQLGLTWVNAPPKPGEEEYASVASPRVFAGSTEIVVPVASTEMLLADTPSVAPGTAVQAIVPARFLRDRVVTFDYPRRKLIVDDQPATTALVPIALQVDPRFAFPRVELTIAGQSYGFLIDTGASFCMLSQTVLERWKAAHPDWKFIAGAYGSANMLGGKFELDVQMLEVPVAACGATPLRNVLFVSRPPDTFEQWMSDMTGAPIVGALGGNLLRQFATTIDYPNERLYLQHEDDPTALHEFDMVPITLTPSFDGTFTIDGVLGSTKLSVPASRVVGHELLAVDGQLVHGKSLYEVHAMLRGEAGHLRRLRVADTHGVAFEVQAPIVRLF